jgi:hypothetical protein
MIRKYSHGSCSSLVASHPAGSPPLAPNTRTVVVNSGTRVRRSLRLRLHSLRTLGQSSSIPGLVFVARCVSPCGFDSTRSEHSDSRRQFRDSCSSLVAAPPPLAPNTRTVVVNSGAQCCRVGRLVFGASGVEPAG